MLTVKIEWPSDFENYSVYTCKQYVLMALADGTKSMILTDKPMESWEVILGPGSKTYVMNDHGSTVDKIYVHAHGNPPRVGG